MSAFSESLRRLRKAQGLTQEQLATTLYVTRQTISNWENDRAQPDYQMLSTIASVLNVSVSTLLGEDAPADASIQPSESPEPAAQEAQPVFVLSECESLSFPPSDEHPAPDPQHEKKRRIPLPALIIAGILLLLPLLNVVISRPKQDDAPFSIEQFTAEALAEDSSPLLIYTRENSSRYIQPRPEADPYWNVRFFFKATADTALDLEMITTVLFFQDGSQNIFAHTEEQFINTIGHPHIEPGEIRIFAFSTPAQPGILGVGLEVLARDTQGNPLCFKTYKPLEFALQ